MKPYVQDPDFTLYLGDVRDVLRALPDGSADAAVTSPPYLDQRPEYGTLTVSEWRDFFRELRRVVPPTGPAFFNVGRIWRGGVESDWHHALTRIARREGWAKLDEVVWIKPNANPIHGRFFANRHEYVLVLGGPETVVNVDDVRVEYAASSVARLRRGWVKHVGVKGDAGKKAPRQSEPHPLGGLPPSYLVVDTGREKGNPHPCPMPVNLAYDLVAAASTRGQSVLDPFLGSGTTAIAARRLGRRSIGIESNEEYAGLAARSMSQLSLLAEEDAA